MILKEFLDKCSRNENVCILIAHTQFESFVRQPQGLKEDFKGLLDCEVLLTERYLSSNTTTDKEDKK